MRRPVLRLFMLLTLALALCAPQAMAAQQDNDKSDELFKNFSFGVRSKAWELSGDKAFVGTILDNTVDEKSYWYPTNVNCQYLFNDYFGLVLEWDYYEAKMEKDGHLQWQGLTAGVTARYPIDIMKGVVPYAVAGVVYVNPQFKEENWWRYGYPNSGTFDWWMAQRPADVDPYEWMAEYRGGYHRNMKTEDSFGFTYGVGVDIFLTDSLALNLDIRWVQAETNVDYTLAFNNGRDVFRSKQFTYDLDTFAGGIGLRWYF